MKKILGKIFGLFVALGFIGILGLWIISNVLFELDVRGNVVEDIFGEKYLNIYIENTGKTMENVDLIFKSQCDLGFLESPRIENSAGVKECDLFDPVSS